MKTIRVIDLLNMIANGEYDKLPKKVKYENTIYVLNIWYKDYFGEDDNCGFIFGNMVRYGNYDMEVEIIEDNSRVEKLIITMNEVGREIVSDGKGNNKALGKQTKIVVDKLNEVIERLNEVLENENN